MPNFTGGKEDFLKRQEKIKEQTSIIEFDLQSDENRKLLQEYTEKLNKNSIAAQTFNEFVQNHKNFKDSYKDKIVVVKFTNGSLGDDGSKHIDEIKKQNSISSLDELPEDIFLDNFTRVDAQMDGILKLDESSKTSTQPKDSINIDGANFTGCIFNDVQIFPTKHISLRNCSFKDTTMFGSSDKHVIIKGRLCLYKHKLSDEESTLEDVVLSGSNFHKCKFEDFTTRSIRNLHLSYAAPDKLQELGIIEILSTDLEESIIKDDGSKSIKNRDRISEEYDIIEKIEHKKNQEIKTIKNDLLKNKKALDNEKAQAIQTYKNSQPDTRSWIIRAAKSRIWNKEQKETITKIIAEYDKKIEDLIKKSSNQINIVKENAKKQENKEIIELHKNYNLELTDSKLDPTYRPSEEYDPNILKINIEAKKSDLKDYVKSKAKISFSDFIINKEENRNLIKTHQKSNSDKHIIPIVDMSNQDLSKLDLSKMDLRNINFSYCNMEECNLSATKLTGSCLEGCNLKGATLKKAECIECNMMGIQANNKTSFEKAIAIRTVFTGAHLESTNMKEMVAYGADFVKANLKNTAFAYGDGRYADFEGANATELDARYAKLKAANFDHAIMDKINCMQTNLEEATLNFVQAEKANFEKAVMKKIHAKKASLPYAILDSASVQGANFTEANLQSIKANSANFEEIIAEQVDISYANLHKSILNKANLERAKLVETVMTSAEAEDLDIRHAVAIKANFEASNLTNAQMTKINLDEANLKNAILKKVNLEQSSCIKTNFKSANLSNANTNSMNALKANMQHCDITQLHTVNMIIAGANIEGVIGDRDTVQAFQKLSREQNMLFSNSKYGLCPSNEDGTNDRFKCQQLGANILSAAIGGSSGFVLGGIFGSLPASTISALISNKALQSLKVSNGHLDNTLGDRLAEIGAIAHSMGVGAADRAIDGAAAGIICSIAGIGKISGTASAIKGAFLISKIIDIIWKNKNLSITQRISRIILARLAAFSSFIGLPSMSMSLASIAYGSSLGALYGAGTSGLKSFKKLKDFKLENNTMISGARPEDIYRDSKKQAAGIITKIKPTWKKILIGIVFAALCGVVAVGAIKLLPAIGAEKLISSAGLAKWLSTGTLSVTGSTAGFLAGYLYGDSIISNIYESASNKVSNMFKSKKTKTDTQEQHVSKTKDEYNIKSPNPSKPTTDKNQNLYSVNKSFVQKEKEKQEQKKLVTAATDKSKSSKESFTAKEEHKKSDKSPKKRS